jgi:hypothetical protein
MAFSHAHDVDGGELRSKFTHDSVRLMMDSNDYARHTRVVDQGRAFRRMRLLGAALFFVVAIVAEWFDCGSALEAAGSIQGEKLPVVAVVALCVASAWVQAGLWYPVHHIRGHDAVLATHLVGHLAASIAHTATPCVASSPFLRATIANPWPALVPFAATFPVGLALFYARFSGSWRRIHIVSSPFVTAPALLLVTAIVWCYLERVAAGKARLIPSVTFPVPSHGSNVSVDLSAFLWHMTPSAEDIDSFFDSSCVVPDLITHTLVLVNALSLSKIVTPPTVELLAGGVRAARRALLPSKRVVWQLAILILIVAALFPLLSPCPSYSAAFGGVAVAVLAISNILATDTGDSSVAGRNVVVNFDEDGNFADNA